MAGPSFEDGAGLGADDHVDVGRMHAVISRETNEPEDGHEPPPTAWLLCMLAVALGSGWYLGAYAGNFRYDVLDGAPQTAVVGAQAPAAHAEVDPKVLGKRVYNNCMACHQADGHGLAGQFPPLAGSEWVLGDGRVLARILLHGLSGPLQVAGHTYDGVMPAWERLSDVQIASVLTFIRSSFGNAAAAVAPEAVAEARQATAGRRDAWTAAELQVTGGADQ